LTIHNIEALERICTEPDFGDDDDQRRLSSL
jgi:hypothetical protein